MNDEIAIIGSGCRYADARSPDELWHNALAGRRAFRAIPDGRLRIADYAPRFAGDPGDPDSTYVRSAALIEDFELDRHRFKIAGSTARATDIVHWLALGVADGALRDAGFPEGEGLPRASTGVIVGNSLTGEMSRAFSLRLLGMAQARARAEQALFGSVAPARLGRYVLLGKTGDGGMGVVYAAYDPELHRKVALKVLHPWCQPGDRAQERLIIEARALAKLDHPNVVRVHDVITHDDEVVIVMEWVEGHTLARWEADARRSWREVLPVYLVAAHGLAAAHGVGVIHRDFKPANAILGVDRRVRVLDFGLARPTDAAEASPPRATAVAAQAWAANLTETGALVGTLGYASPEQLQGIPATPASDQFSFGVSLHRALEGVPAFDGDDATARAHNIRAGNVTIASDGRVVPAWLRAAVKRTLAADPADRFPSIQAMLTELSRPRGLRRWRGALAVAGVVALAALAVATRRGADAGPALAPCDGGASEIEPVWNPAERARLAGMFATLRAPYAADMRDRVVRGLDDYRTHWIHRDACMSHRSGAQSAAMLDRRMVCLHRRLGDLRSTVSVFGQVDANSAAQAIDAVARMPALDDCADIERMAAEGPPPATPPQRAEVAVVRGQLSQALALERIGRNAEALSVATAAATAAEHVGYAPVIADASLVRGRIHLGRQELEAAARALGHALDVALQQRLFALAVEAGARKIYAEGMLHADVAVFEREAAILASLSVGLNDHFAQPLLLNNLGAVYIAAGDRATALRYFQDAHAALAGVPNVDLELTCIDENLAMLTSDAPAREALVRGAWTRLRGAFGDANWRRSRIPADERSLRAPGDVGLSMGGPTAWHRPRSRHARSIGRANT